MTGIGDVRLLANDPAAFRASLLIDTDTGPRALADVADAWQAADFAALDPGWRRVAGQTCDGGINRAWLERPRGHAKTSDLACMIAWVLFASRRRLSGVAAAADQDQARLLRDAVARLVSLNPWLAAMLSVQRDVVRNTHTDSTLEILTSDAPTSYGLTPDFVVADELVHWRSRDLWDSLFSAAAKRAHCCVVVISNAGWVDSWQWPLREAIRNDPAWHFSRLDGPCASWLTADRLDEQRRLLPAVAYARLWGNQWSSGSGDALETCDIDAAIDASLGPVTRPERGWVYVGGLDLGLRRDSSAFVVVGKHIGANRWHAVRRKLRLPGPLAAAAELGLLSDPEDPDECDYADGKYQYRERVQRIPGTGKLRLASVRVWRPVRGQTVDLSDVERTILHAQRRLHLARLAIDPHQAEHLAQRLVRRDVPVALTPFVPSALQGMATATLEAFTDRQITLFPHDQLSADVRALRVAERSSGHFFRLVSPRGPAGHGDSATALSLALLACREFVMPIGDPVARGHVTY